jgi:hypothetical protein
MTTETTTWVSTQEMAKTLGIAVRTLAKFRTKPDNFLIEGRHFRRSTPSPQAPWIWHLERTTKAWEAEVGS